MKPEYMNIFPTPIQMTKLDLDINKIIEFCCEMKRKDTKGAKISNIEGWQSNNILEETNDEFVKLKARIEEMANIYHDAMCFKKELIQKIYNIWININPKGSLNEWHNHPHSIFSGAFYVKVNTPVVFKHPYADINTHFWRQGALEKLHEANSGRWAAIPKTNSLIIFPPWISHKVDINKEDVDRISISFNTVLYKSDVKQPF